MYFDPSIRGRGLGKELLAKMIEKARNMGYMRVYLETASVLKQAVHIYESAGFRPVDVKHTPRCDQAYIWSWRANEGVKSLARHLSVQEIPRPTTDGEALVRVIKSGICNTDLEIARGYAGFNGTIGHEFVGVVETAKETD